VGGREVRGLRRFVEKPVQHEAKAAFDAGGLWNTLVVAAKLDLLWHLGREVFPDLIRLFEVFGETIGTRREKTMLDALYRVMPAYNFSSDLLARAVHQVAVVELEDVLWSDWGKPERIAETLRRIGKTPAFPLECLEDVRRPAPTAPLRARPAEACLSMEQGAA
jgi:mannose-1-phosphate guanylyltransferase